jgi:hypothetical protein
MFDPIRERAYGEVGVSNYMHLPGQDQINFDIPPLQMPTEDPNDPPETREERRAGPTGPLFSSASHAGIRRRDG